VGAWGEPGRPRARKARPPRTVCRILVAALAFGPPAQAAPARVAASPAPAASLAGERTVLGPTRAAAKDSAADGLASLPLYFIGNEGQVDERVAYYVHGAKTSVYLTRTGIVFATEDPSASGAGWAVRLDFEDANPDVRIVGRERTDAVVSYFKGRPSEWKTGLATWSAVVYEDLWPGIDLVYGSEGGRLKYTFLVEPGADPGRIRLAYRGASSVRMTAAGRLSVATPAGSFEEEAPLSWQDGPDGREVVASAFEPAATSDGSGYRFGFRLGAYDPTKPLVIDPVVLTYCGYLGGTAGGTGDEGFGIAVDNTGAAYVVGATTSADFPFTAGAFDTTQAGGRDAFVAKVNAAGTALVYATFIGGTLDDVARAVAADGSGNAYVAGETASSEGIGWPVLLGPDLTYAGNTDGFVLKLNAAGTGLVYSGYIGGSGTDRARAIAVDAAGSAYVGGTTTSDATTFPETAGAYDLVLNNQDGFVAKLTVGGGAFSYCTYLGNNGAETLQAIAVDAAGSAYVAGYTDNTTVFPTTGGAYDTTANGGNDGFVTKFNAAGSALVYSTLLGGTALDNPIAMALDAAGNAYVAGQTTSSDFPRTSLQSWSGGNDGFVTRLNTTGTALVYSGFVGGTGFDAITGIAVDTSGSAFLAGNTDSTQSQGFPVAGDLDLTYNGGFSDAFAARVDAAGTALVFCGYIGGSGDEQSGALAIDASGGVYFTGTTTSTEATFPETVGPDLTHNGPGSNDAFVAKLQSTTAIYYSVGTQAAALYSGNASAASGTLTLASAAASNVGVGDEIRHGASRYYITGRTSPTVFSIQDSAANGGTPGATGITFASTAITIFRAFNLLSTAEANSSDASHLNTANLVAGRFQLNWPCYNDGPMDDQVTIGGYTTGAASFIRVYTPVLSSQVGAGQRHTGKARTGFRLRPTSALDNDSVRVSDSFVRVEGIEIDGSASTAPNGAGGVSLETFAATPVEHHVSANIIYETRNFTGIYAASMLAKVWNNVLHNVDNTALGAMTMSQGGGTGYFYNNTVYDHAGHGIRSTAGTMIATNNVSMLPGGGFQDFNGAITQGYNVSSDGTAAGTGSQTGKVAYASYFRDTTVGAEDLHLKGTSLGLWLGNGTDLSASPDLPVTNDIDSGVRVRPDIGADEFTAIGLFRSAGPRVTPLATGAGNALTIAGSTATFAVALPANVGVGDALQYDSDGNGTIDAVAFIHGRASSQVYTVRNAQGAAPAAVAGDNDWSLYRAYTTLANWESQSENANINATVRNFDTSPDLVAAGVVMNVACYADGNDTVAVTVNGWTTSAEAYISIFTPYVSGQVGTSQRHAGVWDPTKYTLVVGTQAYGGLLVIQDEHVRVTGLQIESTVSKGGGASQRPAGIELTVGASSDVRVSHNIMRNTGGGTGDYWAGAIIQNNTGGTLRAWNNVMYGWGSGIFSEFPVSNPSNVTVYNNTIVGSDDAGIAFAGHASGTYRVANNLVQGAATNYSFGTALDYSATNLSQDATSPQVGLRSRTVAFVGAPNYHLSAADTMAKDQGTDLSADPVLAVYDDIDGQLRAVPWDIGMDDANGTTAVKLISLAAVPGDSSVTVEWRTGSELDNLGFHLYRGPSASGPWTRLTSTLVPGLGSSPLGQAYSWLDTGLTNGTRYYYRLEDVDTASRSTFHPPVSTVPVTAPSPPGEGGEGGGGGDGAEPGDGEPVPGSCPTWVLAAAPDAASPVCTRHGDPDSTSFQILARGSSSATVELHTGGFWALHGAAGEAQGDVRVFVPGLEFPSDPKAPALPVRRALVDAVVGKQVHLVSAEAFGLQPFPGLRPSAVGHAEMSVSRDGTVRPSRRALPARFLSRGHVPAEVARLVGTVFQGERKSAVVEIAPVRLSGGRDELVLASRVRVTLSFAGVAEGEVRTGSGGRALPPRGLARDVLAQLHTSRRGLHAVRYEELFPTDRRGLPTSLLRLQRQGEAVPFRVESPGPVFGPGGVLYFHADRTVSSTEYSSEVAYELVRGTGVRMGAASAVPVGGPSLAPATGLSSFEVNRVYQPGLLEAPDIWLWDGMASGVTRTQGFTLSGLDTSSTDPARLVVSLQGGSESGTTADHHVRVSLNGASVGEATFAGKRPHALEVPVPASLLREGANELSVANLGDTGAYSLVFLDRLEVSHPQRSTAQKGVFEGVWSEGGTVEVEGVTTPVVILRDPGQPGPEGSAIADPSSPATDGAPRDDGGARDDSVQWITGFQANPGSVRFQAEAGYRYTVVSPEGLLSPRIGRVPVSTLKAGTNQADYLLIAPREFLEAAQPLLERRRAQGLESRGVSFEEIASEFGHGQPSAEAIRAFLSHAYHSWREPSPRYVVLLGDATYDPRRFQPASWASPLPALWTKTSYLWTASDPALAAVNGDDLLPDLAIGRLPATTREQAESLVSKLLAWEDSGQGLNGAAVLVADDPDVAGDFEADVADIRASFLGGRPTTTLRLSELGAGMRPAILGAFDDGASLMSYVGHGGAAVWASENVLNSWDTPSLRAQSRQPLLLTLNCLNGYFVAPSFDSLSEALVKAEGRGAVAALSPSGLSLDGPAHQYHRAVMAELVSGAHERLGDALLAAQATYAQTGLMPELLSVYQLLGDPGTRIR
jgi:hypothetical protein